MRPLAERTPLSDVGYMMSIDTWIYRSLDQSYPSYGHVRLPVWHVVQICLPQRGILSARGYMFVPPIRHYDTMSNVLRK